MEGLSLNKELRPGSLLRFSKYHEKCHDPAIFFLFVHHDPKICLVGCKKLSNNFLHVDMFDNPASR